MPDNTRQALDEVDEVRDLRDHVQQLGELVAAHLEVCPGATQEQRDRLPKSAR